MNVSTPVGTNIFTRTTGRVYQAITETIDATRTKEEVQALLYAAVKIELSLMNMIEDEANCAETWVDKTEGTKIVKQSMEAFLAEYEKTKTGQAA